MAPAESSVVVTVPDWRCRWCGTQSGTPVLDLGLQPAADFFPWPTDPLPDPRYPLRMVLCSACRLAQLEDDPTEPEQPLGVEPQALIDQAREAIEQLFLAGLIPNGATVREFPSPHGGLWSPSLHARGLRPVMTGRAQMVIDSFGLMHAADQREALLERVRAMSTDGTLVVQFHSLATIIRQSTWNALRHGHYAYYSTPTLVSMAESVGLTPVACAAFALYGGTILIAFQRKREGIQTSVVVQELIDEELALGVHDPARLSGLGAAVSSSAVGLRRYVADGRARGLRFFGYGAASRCIALLAVAGLTSADLDGIADASPGKQGRTIPVSRVPIRSPELLIAANPDRVLLFVPDMLDEIRSAFPEVESHGGRWAVVEPTVHEVSD